MQPFHGVVEVVAQGFVVLREGLVDAVGQVAVRQAAKTVGQGGDHRVLGGLGLGALALGLIAGQFGLGLHLGLVGLEGGQALLVVLEDGQRTDDRAQFVAARQSVQVLAIVARSQLSGRSGDSLNGSFDAQDDDNRDRGHGQQAQHGGGHRNLARHGGRVGAGVGVGRGLCLDGADGSVERGAHPGIVIFQRRQKAGGGGEVHAHHRADHLDAASILVKVGQQRVEPLTLVRGQSGLDLGQVRLDGVGLTQQDLKLGGNGVQAGLGRLVGHQ